MYSIQIKDIVSRGKEGLFTLYRSVGWINYCNTPHMLEKAYENSLCALGAYSGNRLIGVIRAVGDGYSILYIQDLIVSPSFQRMGIGSLLLKKLIERFPDVYQTVLLTDHQPDTIRFYQTNGFSIADQVGCTGMLRIKNK